MTPGTRSRCNRVNCSARKEGVSGGGGANLDVRALHHEEGNGTSLTIPNQASNAMTVSVLEGSTGESVERVRVIEDRESASKDRSLKGMSERRRTTRIGSARFVEKAVGAEAGTRPWGSASSQLAARRTTAAARGVLAAVRSAITINVVRSRIYCACSCRQSPSTA
jgi:hypothetical protein